MSDFPSPTDRYNNTATSSNAVSHQRSSSWESLGSGSGSSYSTTLSRARAVRNPRSPTPQLPSYLLPAARSGSLDPDFGRGWSSGSLFEDEEEEEEEIDEEKELVMIRKRTSESSGGSGDKMSDEDKERLTTVQRGENRNLEDWFKELNQQVGENNGTMGEYWGNGRSLCSSTSSQKDNQSDSSTSQPIHHQFYNPHQQHSHRTGKQRFKPSGNQGDDSRSGFSTSNTTDNANGSTSREEATTQAAAGDQQRKYTRRSSGGNANTRRTNESSEGDDFRDIVDDLTVKNHKLRERLKKLENIYGSHRQKDNSKLFEVRYYHVPREKRRELEDLLRAFTVRLQHPKEGPTPFESSNSASSSSDPDAKSVASISPAVQKAVNRTLVQEQTKSSSSSSMSLPFAAMTLLPNTPSNLLKQEVVSTLEKAFTTLPADHMLKIMVSSATDGWIFLNVLVAMVKGVSDLGVPVEYLRHCIRTGSQLLELSLDGQKARLRRNANKDNHSLHPTKKFHVDSYTHAQQLHHQNGDDGEDLSKPSEHFSSNDDTDMQQPQAQDAQQIAPTSNDAVTSQSRVHSSPNSVSSGHTRSTSSSSYFQPYTPLFSRGTTDNSSSSSLMSLYSNSSSSSSDGEKRKKLETAPVIYVEGGTYCLDLSKDVGVENGDVIGLGADNVPKYDRVTNVVLGDVIRSGPKGPPKNKCFNCGSIEHSLQNCLQPRDTDRIRVNLDKYRGENPTVFHGRFHTEAVKYTRFKPGALSFELRKALGLIDSSDSEPKEGPGFPSGRLPEYYYNMRIHGYPPGYLGYNEGDDPLDFSKQIIAKATFDTELKTADNEYAEEEDFIKVGSSNDSNFVRKVLEETEAQGMNKPGMPTKKRKAKDMDANEHANADREMRWKIAKVKDRKQRSVRLVEYPGIDWDIPVHDFAARVYGYGAGTSRGASLDFREGNNGVFSFSAQDHLWNQQQRVQMTTDYNYNYAQYNYDPHQGHQQQQYVYAHGQYDQSTAEAVVQWQNANYAYATSTLPAHSSLQSHPPPPPILLYVPPPPLTPPPLPPPPPSVAPSVAPSSIPPGESTMKLQNTAHDIFDNSDDDMDISDSESQGQLDSYTSTVSSISPSDATMEAIGVPATYTDSSNTTGSNSSQQSSDSLESQVSGLPVHSVTIEESAFGFATRQLEAQEHEERSRKV